MKIFLVALVLCLFSLTANAEFFSRLDGQAYYDDQLNITWTADANINGNDTWDNQVAWAAGLTIGGVSGWRLPTADADGKDGVVDCRGGGVANCKDNELGFLLFEESIAPHIPGPFKNLMDSNYWYGTDDADDAWFFSFTTGNQLTFGKEGSLFAWAVHDGDVGDITPGGRFGDVPTDHWALSFINTLADSGITAGCGNTNYCPASPVTRAQMAVFLERGIHGSDFSPPAAIGNVFLDVSAGSFAASFIEQFFLDGITSGCGSNNYCPDAEVTRDQMAVFLLRAEHGADYSPPPATGIFNDVPLNHWAVHWIEQLAAEGITSGCGNDNYCPDTVVTRDQMAVFLVRTFGL